MIQPRKRQRHRPIHLAGLRPLALGPFLLALICLALGSLFLFLTAREMGAPGPLLQAKWEQALSPPWGILFIATLFPTVAISLLDLALPWPRPRDLNPYAALASESARDTLEEVRARVEECTKSGEERIAAIFDELLRGAVRLGASDLHLSPAPAHVVVTYRVDGVLAEVCRIPSHLGPQLATRVKVLARLDTYARNPQDGKLRRQIGGDFVEARVSTLPVERGERVVLRITRGRSGVPALTELGFETPFSRELQRLLAKPQGLLLVSGPVGSGKTTTLYSALQHIHDSRGSTSSLVTLEDPIELQLSFATQTQINPHTQMSFAQTLRSVLRQDPNVLMLGEIRDQETAGIACQAGLTGHLILSTLHVDRAAGTFPRLLDMGVEPFVLASTVIGALSQRLVRTLCTHCRAPAEADTLTRTRLEQLGIALPEGAYCRPVGCTYCEGRGFAGRAPIGELLVMTDALRAAVGQRAPTEELHRLAIEQNMIPLIEAGLQRARSGDTSLDEVLRVVG